MDNQLLERAERLERFSTQDPNNVELLRDLAQTYHLAGDHPKALSVLDRIEPDQREADDPLRGQLLLSTGRFEDAATLFERALSRHPDSAALWFNLGYSLYASERAQEAAPKLHKAMELEPANPRVRRFLALTLVDAGREDQALQTLNQAVVDGAIDAELLITLSQLELDAGHIEDASAAANRAVAAAPSNALAWQAKGQAALFALDPSTAGKALRQSLEINPADVDSEILLAQANIMLGKSHLARRSLSKVKDQGRANAEVLSTLGWACCADNDAAAAKEAFGLAINHAPDNVDALNGMTCVLLAEGDLPEAQRLNEQALALDADHVIGKLLSSELHKAQRGGSSDASLMGNLLAAMPFGPLDMSLQQALENPKLASSANRYQRKFSSARR